jgi:hypothetical protein
MGLQFGNLDENKGVVGLKIKFITHVLGVSWDTTRDTLFTDDRDRTDKGQQGPSTKRTPPSNITILRPNMSVVALPHFREANFAGILV